MREVPCSKDWGDSIHIYIYNHSLRQGHEECVPWEKHCPPVERPHLQVGMTITPSLAYAGFSVIMLRIFNVHFDH